MAGEPFEPVVVGVDTSPASLAAVDLAADEAMARVAPLVVVYAVGEAGGGAAEADRLQVAMARTRAEHPGLAVSGELAGTDPVTALTARATGASLLVLGAHGRQAVPSAVDVPWRVAAQVAVPLIVHRPLDCPSSTPLPRPVLLGVSGTADSDGPVEFAFAEAALRGAPLLAVHVWAEDCGSHDEAERVLIAALERWAEKYPEVRIRLAARHGLDVPVALTAASRSCQLAVIGRGRRTGPVFDVLLRRAHCPVAIVPA